MSGMLARPHALFDPGFIPLGNANSICIPLRSFIVSIYYWIFSTTREKPSHEDAVGLFFLLV